MVVPGIRTRNLVTLVGFLLMIVVWSTLGLTAEVGMTGDEDPLLLLGPVTREELEEAVPAWVVAGVEATPDLEAAGAMVAALPGAEVTVYLGTWCSDSGRELSRLWRALDDLGVWQPAEIRYVGVDRDMSSSMGWVAGKDLQWVPTIVVSRGGQETGRIVESSPNGIERDLLALLRGDKVGPISGSQNLEPDGGED